MTAGSATGGGNCFWRDNGLPLRLARIPLGAGITCKALSTASGTDE